MRPKQQFSFLFAALALFAAASGAFAASNDNSHTSKNKLLPSEANTVKVVQEVNPSVVGITIRVEGIMVSPLENMPPAMRQFFKEFNGGHIKKQKETELAAGSGFIVDQKGHILTNYHVVAATLKNDSTQMKNDASIKARFSSGEKLSAKVLGVDESHDLALLELKDKEKLPKSAHALKLANSDHIKVGQKAIAIGNPFLLYSTVTQGIVSAINREQAAKVSGVPISYIQTDAAMNPGSSGGPLLNSQGQVIGIDDEILAPHGTFIGVGLAIPSNLISENLDALEQGKFLKKAEIGIAIEPVANYPKAIREQLGIPNQGLMIVKVKKGSPGDKAGLKGAQFTIDAGGHPWPAGGDIILKADGKTMQSARELQDLVFSKSAGSKVNLLVQRKDKKEHVTVKLEVLKTSNAR